MFPQTHCWEWLLSKEPEVTPVIYQVWSNPFPHMCVISWLFLFSSISILWISVYLSLLLIHLLIHLSIYLSIHSPIYKFYIHSPIYHPSIQFYMGHLENKIQIPLKEVLGAHLSDGIFRPSVPAPSIRTCLLLHILVNMAYICDCGMWRTVLAVSDFVGELRTI